MWTILFGVLRPYVSWAFDYDLGKNGSWIAVGGDHDFEFGKWPGLGEIPLVRDLTITPSCGIGFDYRYLHRFSVAGSGRASRKVANVTYRLDVSYDVSRAARLRENFGSLKVGGFLAFSQAVRRDLLRDEFFGGLQVAYEW